MAKSSYTNKFVFNTQWATKESITDISESSSSSSSSSSSICPAKVETPKEPITLFAEAVENTLSIVGATYNFLTNECKQYIELAATNQKATVISDSQTKQHNLEKTRIEANEVKLKIIQTAINEAVESACSQLENIKNSHSPHLSHAYGSDPHITLGDKLQVVIAAKLTTLQLFENL